MKILFFFLFSLSTQVVFSKDSGRKVIPEVHFETTILKIKNKQIKVEVARTPAQQEHGLMYRTKLEPDQGMVFIFPTERTLSFWMKNTYIDLAIAYINKKRKIIDIHEMKATSMLAQGEPRSYPSARPAMYALEMNKGWFKKNKISLGDEVVFQDQTLSPPGK